MSPKTVLAAVIAALLWSGPGHAQGFARTPAPEGALTRLVATHALGPVIAPRDEAAIARFLADQLRAPTPPPVPAGIERYDRRALAGEFAAVMREASSARR